MMPAPVFESIAALMDQDPRGLDDDALRTCVRTLMTIKSSVDAAVLATASELDQRGAYFADEMIEARAWLAHHTAIARGTAGAMVWLTKRLRYMPEFAH